MDQQRIVDDKTMDVIMTTPFESISFICFMLSYTSKSVSEVELVSSQSFLAKLNVHVHNIMLYLNST